MTDMTAPEDSEQFGRRLRNELREEEAGHGAGLAEAVRDVDPDRVPADGEDATEPD